MGAQEGEEQEREQAGQVGRVDRERRRVLVGRVYGGGVGREGGRGDDGRVEEVGASPCSRLTSEARPD